MADFRPASVPYNPTADVVPTTQAPNDYFHVEAQPNDFGAQVGQATEHVGAQLGQAGQQTFQTAQQVQAIANETAFNAGANSDHQYEMPHLYGAPKIGPDGQPIAGSGGFFSQQGSTAMTEAPNAIAGLQQQWAKTRATLPPRAAMMYDQLTRRTHQFMLEAIGRHAAQQGEVWQNATTQSYLNTTSQAASLAAVNGNYDLFDNQIDQGTAAAQHWADLKGLGTEWGQEQSQKFVGTTVANAAKQMIDAGQMKAAAGLVARYQDQMDKGSVLAIKGALKGQARAIQASTIADSYLKGAPPTDAPVRANLMTPGTKWGDPEAPDFAAQHLTQIQAPNGQSVAVNKAAATAFQGFLGDLKAEGYNIGTVEGYNNRAIRGSTKISQHAFGNAIDINPADNPMGTGPLQTNLPANVGQLAAKWGLVWGGDWHGRKDPMHFEWAGSAPSGAPAGTPQTAAAAVPLPTLINAFHDQESSGGVTAPTSTAGAEGAFQIEPATFAQFAKPGEDIHNPADNAAVGQRILTHYYQEYHGDVGRVAVAYFSGPGNVAPAGSPAPWITDKSDGNKLVSAYVSDVESRLGVHGGRSALYADKASVLSDIHDRYGSDPALESAIVSRYNQGFTASILQQRAQEQARLQQQDNVFDEYLKPAMSGQPIAQLLPKLAQDPRLNGSPATREKIYNALQTVGQGKAYGSDFYSLFQKVHADGTDKITDAAAILPMVDGSHLTLEGFEKLRTEMGAGQSADTAAVTNMRKAALAYVKHKLSFAADYGTFKLPDPVGEDIFNSKAVPAFYKAYDDGIKAGKTPFQLLSAQSPDYIGDKVINAFKRSQAQEMKDRIANAIAGDAAGAATPAPSPKPTTAYNLTTPEGVLSAFRGGSISRAEFDLRLNAMRAALQANTQITVPVSR